MKYSLESYRLIIKQALSVGWNFSSFNLKAEPAAKLVYLRHDVDYSPAMALELARVNAELNIAGTFFLLPHSQTYNLFSAGAQNTVRQIYDLGQHIALHTAISATSDDLEVRLRNDFEFVKSYLPMISPVFSWHNPTADVLERHLQSENLAGLLNVYAAHFTHDITYASDSNMRHNADYFFALFDESKCSLQLLLHPLNWVAGGSNMREVFAGTWPYVIREKEQEMLSNRYYRGIFPSGMPDAVLQAFTERWFHAAESESY